MSGSCWRRSLSTDHETSSPHSAQRKHIHINSVRGFLWNDVFFSCFGEPRQVAVFALHAQTALLLLNFPSVGQIKSILSYLWHWKKHVIKIKCFWIQKNFEAPCFSFWDTLSTFWKACHLLRWYCTSKHCVWPLAKKNLVMGSNFLYWKGQKPPNSASTAEWLWVPAGSGSTIPLFCVTSNLELWYN